MFKVIHFLGGDDALSYVRRAMGSPLPRGMVKHVAAKLHPGLVELSLVDSNIFTFLDTRRCGVTTESRTSLDSVVQPVDAFVWRP